MEIILHAHHADVPDSLRTDAETATRKVAARLNRVVDAIIRFVGDGATRRVEIVLHGAHHKDLFAHANARAFGPALAVAVQRLESQVARTRRSRRPPGDRTG